MDVPPKPSLEAEPHADAPRSSGPPRRLVVAGATGLIGRRVVAAAQAAGGYAITVLTRDVDGSEPDGTAAVEWSPSLEPDGASLGPVVAALEGADAVVNLAGSSIAAGRLGPEHRRRVRDSRLASLRTLLAAAERCDDPPSAWFYASGVGYYGDRGDERLDESAGPDPDHVLYETTRVIGEEARAASAYGRVVVGRLGMVLAPEATAWQRYLLPIRLFVGGPLGSGRQWLPWIEANDAARAILFLLEHDDADGPVNLVAPTPARQIEITRAAAQRLRRPSFVPAPAWALRLVLGGVADALLLTSARVLPARLQELGFEFEHPDIERAMDELID